MSSRNSAYASSISRGLPLHDPRTSRHFMSHNYCPSVPILCSATRFPLYFSSKYTHIISSLSRPYICAHSLSCDNKLIIILEEKDSTTIILKFRSIICRVAGKEAEKDRSGKREIHSLHLHLLYCRSKNIVLSIQFLIKIYKYIFRIKISFYSIIIQEFFHIRLFFHIRRKEFF